MKPEEASGSRSGMSLECSLTESEGLDENLPRTTATHAGVTSYPTLHTGTQRNETRLDTAYSSPGRATQ